MDLHRNKGKAAACSLGPILIHEDGILSSELWRPWCDKMNANFFVWRIPESIPSKWTNDYEITSKLQDYFEM